MEQQPGQENQQRRWMRLLQGDLDALQDFNDWVDQHIMLRTYQIVNSATSMDEILGMRYLVGELEQMQAHVNLPLQEEAQLKELHYHGGHDVEPVAHHPRTANDGQEFWRNFIRDGLNTEPAS